MILTKNHSLEELSSFGGGKAKNLYLMTNEDLPVPSWICVSSKVFENFKLTNGFILEKEDGEDLATFSKRVEETLMKGIFDDGFKAELEKKLSENDLNESFLAIRSSGLDEDSKEHSFAGQFSSYLFQKGADQILKSLKLCWASAYSERCLHYRMTNGLPMEGMAVGVVIQKMVNSEMSGVSFSRNPIHPLDRKNLIIESVYGQGEGLVSGALDADNFTVDRKEMTYESQLATKKEAFFQNPNGGLERKGLSENKWEGSSLNDKQIKEISQLVLKLEVLHKMPQDVEWAIEEEKLYLLQTRPITTLPPDAFFNPNINGHEATLWDNSNIIESYSGVTSPLTFTFASYAYREVYRQFCEVMGISSKVVEEHENQFRNMLLSMRGHVYYNLINWYKIVLLLPGSSGNAGFMDTMMGVKQNLKPEIRSLFDFMENPPEYSLSFKMGVYSKTIWRFIKMDHIIDSFQMNFNSVYNNIKKTDFTQVSLPKLMEIYEQLENQILKDWKAPIINDYLCMIFFGLLKKLTTSWVDLDEDKAGNLQNDLLCGEGDLRSTEPTKMLMSISDWVDNIKSNHELKSWLLETSPDEVWKELKKEPEKFKEFKEKIDHYLDQYGFRCVAELKLESKDLHDDPSFVINAIISYIKSKSYSIKEMEKREREIRANGEKEIEKHIGGWRRMMYYWILKQTRRAVKNRENLRFDRTKIFGIARHIFRAIGGHFQKMGVLEEENDIFYLTVEEIRGFIEGRALVLGLKDISLSRKKEYEKFESSPPPPDRFLTYGAASASGNYSSLMEDADLLKSERRISDDPNVLLGTPCCPGVIEGEVLVAHDIKDTEKLDGQILVTSRTDPGWVPLYPSSSGLLIERGSLLSHSAVVARELGLPTIVGVDGGLMDRLKTGMKVRVDAGKGEIRILENDD